MKRIDEFRKELEQLLEKYSDIPLEELSEELDYYSIECARKR